MPEFSVTVKSLPGSKEETILINSTASGSELKRKVASSFSLSTDEQKLMIRGKVIRDQDSLESQGVKSGDKIHLMVTKSSNSPAQAPSALPETDLARELKYFLRPHFAEPDAKTLIQYVHKDIKSTAEQMSLDHIERIAEKRLA